jgi:hypothetical protein
LKIWHVQNATTQTARCPKFKVVRVLNVQDVKAQNAKVPELNVFKV